MVRVITGGKKTKKNLPYFQLDYFFCEQDFEDCAMDGSCGDSPAAF